MLEVLALILLIGHAAAKYPCKSQDIHMRNAFSTLEEDPHPKDLTSFNLFPARNVKLRFNYKKSNKSAPADKVKNLSFELNFLFKNPISRNRKKKSSTASWNRKSNN